MLVGAATSTDGFWSQIHETLVIWTGQIKDWKRPHTILNINAQNMLLESTCLLNQTLNSLSKLHLGNL